MAEPLDAARNKKLRGAPEDFKRFIGDVAQRLKKRTTCSDASAVGVSVDTVRTDGYTVGGVKECGGYAELWAKGDGRWKQVQRTQESWDLCGAERVPGAQRRRGQQVLRVPRGQQGALLPAGLTLRTAQVQPP